MKENGISIGNKSKTWYHNAIAIGNEAETGNKGGVTSNDSIAIGNKAKIQGQKNVAIGSGVTVGTGSTSSGSSYVVAIGSESKAYDTDSVVIGGHSEVHENATVVGNRSKADMQSVALGSSVEAGKWSVAIGLKSKAKNHAIAMGMDSDVAGEYSIAIGEEAKTPLDKSVSIGYQAKAETQESLAIGDRAVVYGENITEAAVSTAIGSQAKVYGKNAIALGGSANVGDIWQKQMADGGTAIGSSSNAAMENATAIGYKSIAYGKDAVTIGAGTRADIVEGGVALGSESNVGSYVDSKYGIAGKVGYDPLGTDANGTSTWKSTKAAVSVGNQQKDITRQIINVAAGTDNTDAVNVAQLKSLGRKAWNDLAEAKDELGGRIATNTGNITKLSTRVGTNERDIGRLKTDVSTNDTRIRYLYSNMPFRHFISVNEEGTNTTLPNYKNEGAKKAGSIAIGVNTTAYGEDAVALGGNLFAWGQSSVIVGESSDNYTGGVTAKEGQFDQSIILGSNNTIFAQSAENGGREDKIIGNMNRVEESHGTFVRGTGNMVYDAYNDEALTDEDKQKEQDFLDPLDGGDPTGLFQKGRSHVTVEGDGNLVAGSLYTQVSGVGNEVSNSQPDENGPSTPRVTYNIVTGNRNTVVDSSHNLIMGDNHELENVNGNIIIGSLKTKAKTEASNVTILGNDANVSVDGGVALGAKSVADRDKKVPGYDPATKAASTKDNEKWKSTLAAVSVGNATDTRQITNVAAGSEDTDAVNVAQLKALNQKVDEGAVHYYSVKSNQQAAGTNYANDGAKAADSMVIGISSSISEKAKNSTVLGNNNTLSNQPNARGVERDSENNSIVVGQNLTVEGARNAVFGTDYQNGTDKLLTHVAGERNTVIGVGNLVGYTAERVGTEWKYTKFKGHGDDENVVVGLTNTVNGGGVVVGTNTTVSAYGGVAFGHHNIVSGDEDKGVALGNDLNVSGYGALAVGTESTATGDYTIALGVESKAQSNQAASMGYQSRAKASESVALGAWSNAEAKQAVALGAMSVADRAEKVAGYDPATKAASTENGKEWKSTLAAVSVGNAKETRQITGVAAGSEDTDAVNVAQLKALNKQVTEGAVHYFSVKADDSANPVGTNWNNDGAKSTGSIAVGQKARTLELEVEPWKTPEKISSDHAVALGSDASAAGNGSVAIGKNAVTGTRFATESLGGGASLTTAHNIAGDGAVAVGDSSQAGTEGSVAIGRKATAGYYGALLNHTTKEKKSYGIAIGDGAKAIGNYNRYSRNDNRDDAGLAVGRQAYAAGNGTIAMGYKAHAANTQNIIIGSNASTKALFKNDGEETVHPISSVGIGSDVVVKGRYSVALGPGASVGNGKLNLPESTSFMDFGGVALGYKSQVDRPGSVGLGSWTRPWRQVDPKHPIVDPEHPEQPIDEQTKYADGKKVVAPFSGQKLYFKDDIGGAQVYHAMGSNSVVNGVVSVGGVYEGLGGRKIPFLRQIINVADGTEDTDAVNLRQLKAVNADVTTDIKALQDGFTVSNAAGEKQNIALGGDTKQNIKFQGEAGKIDVDVAHASDGATVTVKANANLGKNIDLSSNTTVTNITNNLSRGFELRAGTEITGAKIALDGNETPAIRFDVAEADKGLTVKREGNTVKYGIDGSKIDLTGNTAITNITSNLSQASAWKLQVNGKNERVIGKDNVVNFVAGSYTEVTADGNDVKIGLNKAAKDKLDKVDTLEGQIKANKVQVTGDAVTGVKVADKKEADGSTTYTVSLDKKIQVGGVAVNGKDGKGEVTGLTNTSLNVAGFATSKRAATEEQLQLAMDQMSANAKITTVESGDENIVVNKTEGQNENKYTVALNKNLNVDSLNAGGTQVNKDGISVRGADGKPGVTITKNGIDAGNKKITNVADGVDAHDAATVGQLGKLAEDAGKGLNELGNQISKLDGRVNKVGAGAAALAAMHPLDFDPDDKWNVSAGYGSYKGSHAGAIGAFYRPDENTMFNIGASVGGGENMVNAGVTFALDRKSHITTSRTAMAREIMDLRKEITELKAARANGNWMLDPEMTKLFPDVPENHWAYEYIAKLAGNGIIKGYPDGSFAGNRMMTRYEFAALLYRAMENGANVDARALKEFAPEMGRIRVDRVYGKDNDRNKIERVRVNNENTQERDTYGSKIQIAAK